MKQSGNSSILSLVILLLFCINDNGLAFILLHSTSTSTKSIQRNVQQQHQPLFSTVSSNTIINDKQEQSLKNLNVVIVGGGPSGLLVAHGLVSAGATVTVYEKRSRPLNIELEQRAYALGIGVRGRTAIQNIDTIFSNVPSVSKESTVKSSVLSLWESIKQRGYGSERFILHIGPFTIKLRDGDDSSKINTNSDSSTTTTTTTTSTDNNTIEPSLLLYQSDLCRTLADEIDVRYKNTGRIKLKFNTAVSYIDLDSKTITTSSSASTATATKYKKTIITNPFVTIEEVQQQKYDLLIGCDGVNSIVRQSLQSFYDNNNDSSTSSTITSSSQEVKQSNDEILSTSLFQSKQEKIPGYFKVVRLPIVPPLVDPTAVQLLFPKKGSTTCFVEPTSKGRSCLLFAGSNTSTDILLSSPSTSDESTRISDIEETLVQRYPKLVGTITSTSDNNSATTGTSTSTSTSSIISTIAKQLYDQEPAQASTIQCNTYHCPKTYIALVGDAAHATGGVSGQGVNSALQDSYTLVQSLINTFQQQQQQQEQNSNNNNNKNSKEQLIQQSLLQYSKKSVPEGKALYDLSFGPNNKNSITQKVRYSTKSIIDTLFKGKYNIGQKPLQTLLTISNESFSSIRRNRNKYYSNQFPTDETFQISLSNIHNDMLSFGQQSTKVTTTTGGNSSSPSSSSSSSRSTDDISRRIGDVSSSSPVVVSSSTNDISSSSTAAISSSPVDIASSVDDSSSSSAGSISATSTSKTLKELLNGNAFIKFGGRSTSSSSTAATSSSSPLDIASSVNDISSSISAGSISTGSTSASKTLKELLNGNAFIKFGGRSSSSSTGNKGTLKQLLGETEFIKF